jgi:anti-anti-sigma factor
MLRESLSAEWPYLLVQVVQRSGRAVSVTGHGEIDMTTVGTLTDTLDTVLWQEQPLHIDVNLAEVTFMDSSGINALVACRAVAEPAGCRITISNPRPMVRRVLAVTGVHDLFGLTPPIG